MVNPRRSSRVLVRNIAIRGSINWAIPVGVGRLCGLGGLPFYVDKVRAKANGGIVWNAALQNDTIGWRLAFYGYSLAANHKWFEAPAFPEFRRWFGDLVERLRFNGAMVKLALASKRLYCLV